MLADHGLEHVVAVRDWADVQAATEGRLLRGVLPVEHGFETDDLAVISETDILGDRLARPRKQAPGVQLPGRGLGPDDRAIWSSTSITASAATRA